MKTLNIFKSFLLGLLIISCSASDDGGDSGSGNGNEEVTSITLTTASTEVNTGAQVAFVVTGNNSSDVTSSSTLKVDGQSFSNPLNFNSEGTYQVSATYNDLTSNTLTITVSDIPASSIELRFNQVCYSTGDTTSFTVLDNFNNTITSEAEVTVNGSVASNPFQFSADGTYNFVATFEGLTSNEVSFEVTPNSGAPIAYTKKVLLEDFTGTWCPQCPPAASAIASAMSGNSNIFGVGYHAVGGDPMEIPETAYWSSYYNVTGFPTVYVNGADTRWNFPNMGQVDSELAETATVGLALETALVAGKLNIEVNVGFNTTPNEQVQLMVYLIEDNVTTSTPQSGSSLGVNYVHKDVLREVYTDQLGDAIEASSAVAGCVYTRNFIDLDLPSNIDDINNLKVIAFVRNTYAKTFVDYFGTTHSNSPHYDIYNVQKVELGETQEFD
ncbi:MAG: Omp28-related outer membrane protein [Formosa sp.]|nr:Omp28-related outer membrane protein [Formosa sp.]